MALTFSKDMGRIHSLRNQKGIAFLVVVLILGIGTLVVGGGVTVYKIAKGQKPSLDIQLKMKKGEATLKIDPEIQANLQSQDLGWGEFAQGVFTGGQVQNQFLVLSSAAVPPPGFVPVVDNPDAGIHVVADPSIGDGIVRASLSQSLQFLADIIDPSIPFTADGTYAFHTTVTDPEGIIHGFNSFAAWAGDLSGIKYTGKDNLYKYSASSPFDLAGTGSIPLGTFYILEGQSLTWDMMGGRPLLSAALSTPEPPGIVLLVMGLVALGLVRVGKWRRAN